MLGNPSAVILAITSSVFASVSLFDMIFVHKLCGKGDSYVHKYREPSYAQYVMRVSHKLLIQESDFVILDPTRTSKYFKLLLS
jgi:hypothetical protein